MSGLEAMVMIAIVVLISISLAAFGLVASRRG
jgi:hypothetical protein